MIREKLKAMGLELPQAAAAAANYVPYVLEGGFLHIAGQLPFLNGQKMYLGRLGETMDLEQGKYAARACALNILAQAEAAVGGDWSRLARCVKLGAFVSATPDFTAHPAVVNGASDLLAALLGDAGKHARFAVGVSSLPFGAAVEIDALFAVR